MMNKTADKGSVEVSKPDLSDQELNEKWKRALADYKNLEKRTQEERRILVLVLTQQVLGAFLPLYDSLKRAQETSPSDGNQALLSQILEILAQFRVTLMEVEGQSFNPEKHEALEVVFNGEDNKVTEVLRDGFVMDNNIVLRPAQVKVSKERKEEKNV